MKCGVATTWVVSANTWLVMFWFLRSYSIIGSGSRFTVNLGSDSLGKSNDLGVSCVSRIHFGFGFIVNSDPHPIIEYSRLVDPFYFIYFGSRQARTSGPILTINTRYDLFPRKKVPFGCRNETASYLGDQMPQTPILGASIGFFKPNS